MADGRVITLTPAEYWELRARQRDIEVAEADLVRSQIQLRTAIEEAKARAAAAFDRLGSIYGLTRETRYAWDDARCTLSESS